MTDAVVTRVDPEADVTPPREHIPAGWGVIAAKEFADHLLSIRFLILTLLMGLVGAFSVYTVSGSIRDAAAEATERTDLFLLLFTLSSSQNEDIAVSFLVFVAFLGPILGIAFGFDAVGSERSEGTLPRLVSQPIHRDDVINGKFVAGLAVIVLILGATMLLIAGVGLFRLGIVPTLDEVLRLVTWFVMTVLYVGFWLALATLASVVFRRAATAALATFSSWLLLGVFWQLVVTLAVGVFSPGAGGTAAEQISRRALQDNISRLSPGFLFQELSNVLLDPTVRWLGLVTQEQVDRIVPAPLSFGQSLLLAWPQFVLMVALTAICFAIAYVVFMRQEVRA